ncbi:hypothetical protein ACWD1Y_39100 [Streptomyces sp. NPDC002814]
MLELQQRNAGERVRRALYALAAEYTTIAAWSCIDARNLDQAQTYLNESATYAGLSQGSEQERPRWTAFYGQAELDHLAAIVQFSSGRHAHAEAMAHRALAKIPTAFRRNRALATAQLALAQLQQGEAEQATATATDVFTIMASDPLPGRMRTLIGDFHRGLFILAPSASYARDWADRMRTDWSRA